RTEHRHTLCCEPEAATGLRAGRNLDPHFAAVDGRYLEFPAQRGAGHRNRHSAMQIGTVALEKFVLRHLKKNIEVPWRRPGESSSPSASKPDARAILTPGRDIYQKGAFACPPAPTATDFARIVDHLAAAVASRARALEREKALRMTDSSG